MKIGFLSICTMLFALCSADCSAYTVESSLRAGNPSLKPITSEIFEKNQGPSYVIKSENLRDGRSFADVVKGVNKTDNSSDKKESKEEKKLKKRMQKLLMSKINFEQNEYDARKIQQNSKRRQSAKIKENKKHQFAHKGKLYNAR